MRRTLLLGGLTLALGATDAAAADYGFGFLRRRQVKTDPAALAKQLVATLQSDPDADRRKEAAEQLRNLDARNFPDIVPALSGALQRDPSVAVRVAAVESLGRTKPVVQSAGLVMEAALAADPDAKVREAVRSGLWAYHLNGYRTAVGTPLTSQTAEPRLAPVTVRTAKQFDTGAGFGFRPITSGVGEPPALVASPEPTLASPRAKPAAKPRVPAPVAGLPVPEIPRPPTPPGSGRNF